VASPARTFLPVPFGARSTDFTAGLRLVRASPAIGQLSHQGLMHQVPVNICFKNVGWQFDGANFLAGHVEN
jgi:hypothetical protein